MSYLDLDLILSEEDRIPVEFLVEGKDLGHLDPNIQSENLPEKSKIEVKIE